jgi:hypothetical protein
MKQDRTPKEVPPVSGVMMPGGKGSGINSWLKIQFVKYVENLQQLLTTLSGEEKAAPTPLKI